MDLDGLFQGEVWWERSGGPAGKGVGGDFLFFQKRCQTCVVCVWAGERIRENGPQMAMGSDHTKWEELQWFLDWGLSGNNPTFLWYPFRYTLLAFLFSLTFALGVLSTRREERREGGLGGGGLVL